MAQLVARYLGGVEAASSSLVTQTNIFREMHKKSSQIVRFRLDFCLLCYCLFASTIPKMVWCIVSAYPVQENCKLIVGYFKKMVHHKNWCI